jgi:diguanylate cyclase (GGDEF)-like protein
VLGDDALRLVARSLSENARQIDVVARYGGEEFVVLLPGTTPEGATAFYERTREDLLERSQKEFGFPLRVSAGAVGSGSGKSARQILAAADGAMYETKRRGKDGIFVPEG